MSCKHCHESCVSRRVTFDDGFDALLAWLHGELGAGTLRESPRAIVGHARRGPPPFETLAPDGPFELDRFAYEFACPFCGTAFELTVDVELRTAEWRARERTERRDA